MSAEDKLKGLKREILALATARQDGLFLNELDREFRTINGRRIPFAEFGFSSLDALVASFSDILKIERVGDEFHVDAKRTAQTAHIQRLVSGQRSEDERMRSRARPSSVPATRPTPQTDVQTDPEKIKKIKGQIMEILLANDKPMWMNDLNVQYSEKHGRPLNLKNMIGVNALHFFTHEMRGVLDVKVIRSGVIVLKLKPFARTDPNRKVSESHSDASVSKAFSCRGTTPQLPYSHVAARPPQQLAPAPVATKTQATTSKEIDVERMELICRDILACNPDGVSYEKFTEQFKFRTGGPWPDWCGLAQLATYKTQTINGRSQTILFDKKKLQPTPSISQNNNNKVVPKPTQQYQILCERLKSGCAIKLSVALGYLDTKWESLLDLVCFQHKDVFDFVYNNGVAYVMLKCGMRSSDAVGRAMHRLDVAIGVQRVPDLYLEQLNNSNDTLDKYVEVVVAQYYSPQLFYLRLKLFDSDLDLLMRRLGSFYSQTAGPEYSIPAELVTVGAHCCAPYQQLGYHRVKVTELLTHQRVMVYYIDYGTVDEAPISQLKYLTTDFARLPAQAIEAQLHNLRPKGQSWGVEVQTRFLELTVPDCPIWAYLYRMQDRLIVDLTRVEETIDVHVSEALVIDQLAIRCEDDDWSDEESQMQQLDAELDAIQMRMRDVWSDDELIDLEAELNCDNQKPTAFQEELAAMFADGIDPDMVQFVLFSLENERRKEETKMRCTSGGELASSRARLTELENQLDDVRKLIQKENIQFKEPRQ